jgi:hypothetical protein
LTHGTNATQIDVDPPGLPVAVAVGDHIKVDNGVNNVTFTASAAAAAGAPSISVTSHAVGTHDYPAHTSTVTDTDQTVAYNS